MPVTRCVSKQKLRKGSPAGEASPDALGSRSSLLALALIQMQAAILLATGDLGRINIAMFTKPRRRATIAFAILCALVVFADTGGGQGSDNDTARLKEQVEQLKKENQELRQSLTQTPTSAQPQPSAPVNAATLASSTSSSQELAYWLTSSSHKRHNSRCRWFHNSQGRSCGPNEGIACMKCGG